MLLKLFCFDTFISSSLDANLTHLSIHFLPSV